METLNQFKQCYGIKGAIQFISHSKGGKVANISMISANGIRVKATIFIAKTIDVSKPLFIFESEESNNFILCNSKLDVSKTLSL